MPARTNTRRGISMIESVIASLLVAMVIASTLGVVGPVVQSSRLAEKQIVAQRLADELIAEIVSLPFEDPEVLAMLDTSQDLNNFTELDPIGTDSGERSAVRADFDDIDDYSGWRSIPPQDKLGNEIDGMTGWKRIVLVQHLLTNNFATSSSERTGAKWFRVQVYFNDIRLANEVIIRTESWDSMRNGS